jgi:large subunit ribosomal protein L29
VRPDEIRVLNDSELARQLDEAHKELFNLRFRLATKQLVNHREIVAVKKKIARMETIKRERELVSEEL